MCTHYQEKCIAFFVAVVDILFGTGKERLQFAVKKKKKIALRTIGFLINYEVNKAVSMCFNPSKYGCGLLASISPRFFYFTYFTSSRAFHVYHGIQVSTLSKPLKICENFSSSILAVSSDNARKSTNSAWKERMAEWMAVQMYESL